MGERSEYSALAVQLQPGQAVDVLHDRVRHVGRLNTLIADWLQERRRLEEQYSAGLRRLARKQLEDVDIGIFSVPWTTLTGALDTMADSHSALASKIEVDVERPLREFATSNREMQAMTTIQGNLASMARDIERAQQKAGKLRGRGERAEAGKVANASSDVDNAQLQWESQAPYVFENLQAVDETRLNMLRDVLTQFQTHEVDMVQKSQTTAEHCLNVLLSLQTEDEIKTFALRTLQSKPRAERQHRPSLPTPTGSRAPPTSFSALSPTMSQPDDGSQRSGSMQEEKKKSRFGGLKRLGTVVGGKKRESKQPSLEPMAESPERKSKASPFNSFSNRLGRSKASPTLEPPRETPLRERPRSPLRLGSEVMEQSSGSRELPTSPTPVQRMEAPPHMNGTSSATRNAPVLAVPIPDGSHQGDLADLEPPKPSQPQPPYEAPAEEMQRDSEGFSVPPSNLDPISQAQADAAAAGEGVAPAFNVNIRTAPIQEERGDSEAALSSVANTLQPPPSVVSRVGTIRGRRQGRPVSSIPPNYVSPPEQQSPETTPRAVSSPIQTPAQPITEEPREVLPSPTEAAAVPLPSPGPTPSLAQSPSGTFAPVAAAGTAFSPFASTMSQQSPFRPDSRSAIGTDHATDAGSIRSGRSLTSSGSQGLKHPELNDAGLNLSVVETVSARFENAKIVSSSLIGEIALAYNPADLSSPLGVENIRLENFASLEKVAPNPAFITQTPHKDGEYSVNLSKLAKTQVAFKYQVRSDDAGSQAPLLVAPAFRIEPSQASIIVAYSLNPAFNMHGREQITLSSVTLALTLEGAKATGCLSKPVGTFSRDKNLIWWQLGDLTLKAGAAPDKLLARFATESEASSGNLEARWEITGEHAQGMGSGLTVSVHTQSQSAGAGDGADPFADDEAANGLTSVWKGVQGVRKLVSGAYSAK
ncbi:hypothetical protein LTR36_008590 [Oleoguttula mirabilis]|uniref:MHD domain-containing protein n=1 Tax=Oleoguttula mirabilis TaxID=1507867 RepID=A0AAV9JT82_9PEZI|nr:hypothetical protein LTR36_008590 [Oleoguttula mirabilis]